MTKISEERVRELIAHHKQQAIHFEQESDGGRFPETLAASKPHWELVDALRLVKELRSDVAELQTRCSTAVAQREAALRELRAYRKEGWVLVPRESTVEMEVAAMKVPVNNTWIGDIYRAMLAAAPEPQEKT